MATKLGDAGLYSDDFATAGWGKDVSPWTSRNCTGDGFCDQVSETINLGSVDTATAKDCWDGVFLASAIYQTFTDTDWSVEVKCNTGPVLGFGVQWGLCAWESDTEGPAIALSSNLSMWGSDMLAGVSSGTDKFFNEAIEGTITTAPYYVRFTRTASTELYTAYCKQDLVDSWTQVGFFYKDSLGTPPTRIYLWVGNGLGETPATDLTFDFFFETAAGDPAGAPPRRVMVRG